MPFTPDDFSPSADPDEMPHYVGSCQGQHGYENTTFRDKKNWNLWHLITYD